MQTPLMFFIAFVVVLALIGLATWLVRRFAGNRLGNGANRGRLPRLAVIDAAAVDGRRRLVLVRRDNVEHLLMIGGPSDIVVEQNIVRASAARDGAPGRAAEPQWSDEGPARIDPVDYVEPAPLPDPTPRPARTAFPDEPRRAAAPPERRDPLPGFSPEPLTQRGEPSLAPREPSREPSRDTATRETSLRDTPRPTFRAEPTMPRSSRSAELPKAAPALRAERPGAAPASAADADKNLAEMAQRLEAALRRPGAPAANTAPPVVPEPPAARAEPAKAAEESPRSQFKNLEDEMASLLGRPKSPS